MIPPPHLPCTAEPLPTSPASRGRSVCSLVPLPLLWKQRNQGDRRPESPAKRQEDPLEGVPKRGCRRRDGRYDQGPSCPILDGGLKARRLFMAVAGALVGLGRAGMGTYALP